MAEGKNWEVSLLLDFYGEMLTEKQREVIDLYYNQDLSLAEISQIAHITRQGVRDSIKRGETMLFEFEEKLHLAQRFQKQQQALQEIAEMCGQLRRYASTHVYSKQIIQLTDQIAGIARQLSEQEENS